MKIEVPKITIRKDKIPIIYLGADELNNDWIRSHRMISKRKNKKELIKRNKSSMYYDTSE